MTTNEYTHRKVILVALDGSPAAATVLPAARTLAAQLAADLRIVHAGENILAIPAQLRAGGSVEHEPLVTELHAAPAVALLAAARQPGVELVALTTHAGVIGADGHLGATAISIIARNPHPTLVVRPEAVTGLTASVAPMRRLLVPFDGAPSTASLLGPALAFASRLQAAIDILYVGGAGREPSSERGTLTAPRYVDQPQHEWHSWTGELFERLRSCMEGWPCETPTILLGHGDIATEIVRVATERQADAILLVHREALEVGRARVIRAVLRQTPCPVLIVGAETA
jgi:nucleotide-binding universal stress UspA family protein